MDDRLRDAYERTAFRVFPGQRTVIIRVGEPTPELDRLLEAHGNSCWAFVTAWNPGSRPAPNEVNERRQQELKSRVEAMGKVWMAGEGVGDDGTWPPEPSLLVLDLDETAARELGREFEQNAVVVGSVGETARLVVL